MSFTAIRWALSQESLEDSKEVLLLVVLADYYNDATGQCNPSRETLMKSARIGNSNTLTAKLTSLQKRGLITVCSKNGKSNLYQLNITHFNSEVPSKVKQVPTSELKHLQKCTTFRSEVGGTSELKVLPTSELKHEPINEPIKEPINTSFVRRAETGSPDAQKNEVAEEEEFNLTEPTEEKELTPEQRANQVAKRCPQEKLIELYHQCLPTLPPVRIWMSARRQQALSARWREMAIDQGFQSEAEGLDFFKRFFEFVGKSPFLMGQVKQKEGRSWRADLEWIVQQKNFEKICDRRYHDH